MDKQTLRKQLLARRSVLTTDQIDAASSAICHHLADWPTFQQARVVLAYLAFRNEVSLQALIDDHPEKRWALPITLPNGILKIHLYQPGRLVRHRWGMLEPATDSPQVPLATIDLALVPGVGFDPCGGRMGFGGGYYDRLLPRLSAATVKVGICHEACFLDAVPCDEHDCRMDWLARPSGLTATR